MHSCVTFLSFKIGHFSLHSINYNINSLLWLCIGTQIIYIECYIPVAAPNKAMLLKLQGEPMNRVEKIQGYKEHKLLDTDTDHTMLTRDQGG